MTTETRHQVDAAKVSNHFDNINKRFDEMDKQFDDIIARLDRIEAAQS